MYWILKIMAAAVGYMSPRNAERLATVLTFLVFDLFRVRRAMMIKNVSIALGSTKTDAEGVHIARESVRHFALTIMEFLRSATSDIAADIALAGEEHIRKALQEGRGVYILCFHVGNWEAMGAKCTRAFAPSHVLVKKVGHGSVDRFVSELREKNGFLTVKRQKKGDGFNAIKEILSRNEIVGFVMDQARPGEPKLPFFGRPAQTNTSFAAIWRRERAPIVPAFIYRSSIGHHTLEFLPEVKPEVTEDPSADVLRHSTEFNAVVEAQVRRFPEQYFWMHNRWK